MLNVQAGLLSVAAINAVYNVIAQSLGRGTQGVDFVVFSAYRDACAAPILYVAALYAQKRRLEGPAGGVLLWPETRSDAARLALQGLLGIYLNQLLFLFGVQLTNGTTGSICNLTLPAFAAAIGVCTGKEKFKVRVFTLVCG